MKKFIFSMAVLLFVFGCSKPETKTQSPIDVVKSFILLCEEGKVDDAEKLLTQKNNVDYFRTFKSKGKDLLYINHDYKGNDDTIELNFEILDSMSSENVAVVKMVSNYKKQHHIFEKNIVLHKVDGYWKIFDFLISPVEVKSN